MAEVTHAVLITDDDGSRWLLTSSSGALYTEAEATEIVRRLRDGGHEIGVHEATVIPAFLPGPELDPALEAP